MNYEDYKVGVPEGQSGNWRVERFVVTEDDAKFSRLRCAINPRPRMLPVPEGQYTRLMHGSGILGGLVMSDTPNEIQSHRYAIHKATGKVLVNGLGLGVVVQAMLRKPEVEKLTVIEISSDVIVLVADHYRTQFGNRLEVVHADAFTWKPPKGMRYDCVWHDVWDAICSDNLPDMHRLHRKYGGRTDWQGSWCRAECEWQKEGY